MSNQSVSRLSPEDRLLRFLTLGAPDECWLWRGAKTDKGYGHLNIKGKHVSAHRLAYSLWVGPIPGGKWVLHKCDMPACCNPSHHFLGDAQANTDDMMDKGRGRWWNPKGAAHPSATISERQARVVRKMLPDFRNCDIAYVLGISRSAVSGIRVGRTWRCLQA